MIIGLTGLPAAGKGTVAAHLVKQYGAKTIRFSDPLRDIIRRLYFQPERESMSHLATFLRSEFGNDILIKTLLSDINRNPGSLYVLDGLRYSEEYDVLSTRSDFVLWSLDTDLEKRYERIIKRPENVRDDQLSLEAFKAQHNLPTEQFIPKLMQKSKTIINNNGTIHKLHMLVDRLMSKIGISKNLKS